MPSSDMVFATKFNLTMHERRKHSLSQSLERIQPQLSFSPAATLRLNSGHCPIELNNEWYHLSKFVRPLNVFRERDRKRFFCDVMDEAQQWN
jgi:hypothetical protein